MGCHASCLSCICSFHDHHTVFWTFFRPANATNNRHGNGQTHKSLNWRLSIKFGWSGHPNTALALNFRSASGKNCAVAPLLRPQGMNSRRIVTQKSVLAQWFLINGLLLTFGGLCRENLLGQIPRSCVSMAFLCSRPLESTKRSGVQNHPPKLGGYFLGGWQPSEMEAT